MTALKAMPYNNLEDVFPLMGVCPLENLLGTIRGTETQCGPHGFGPPGFGPPGFGPPGFGPPEVVMTDMRHLQYNYTMSN